MLPKRPSGSLPVPPVGRRSELPPLSQTQLFETARKRVLARLEDRLDLSSTKRMPPSLLRQSLRQQAEQVAGVEARSLSRPDRERLIEEVLIELLGYGPLEELFNDASVREIMIAGPGVVIVRREQVHWLPTSVQFRDEAHVRATLEKIAAHAETIGPEITSVAMFDVKLPNGFRVLAIIPPEALEQSATATFIREVVVEAPKEPAAGIHPALLASGSASAGTMRTGPGTVTASPRPGSGSRPSPLPPGSRSSATDPPVATDPLVRHRHRILDRLFAKLAALKIYDIQKLEITELRKVVAAYIREYCEDEKIYLSETDQGRLMLEILTAMNR